ncbi:helix-turn-helix domain-containing protein [Sphingomonas sp.]|uniref:helix-turn-helix domain-containing protein n=1 Tax=Sphingomonas sp. TaxID=28214 RepID=UPI0025FDC96C|nr:helix-turn-helix domain-containing protein [Sphingomonas sp.]
MTTGPIAEASLDDQAALVISHDAFGRSQALDRLFRFLVDCAREGRAPKEIEIAREVFDKEAEDDASIRVHVHRLRRKLDEFYAGPGADFPFRLALPKGGYRLVVVPREVVEAVTPDVTPSSRRGWEMGTMLLLIAAILGTWWLARRPDAAEAPLATARASRLWSPIVDGERRIALVVGDYYIFGERNRDGDVSRLVREFDVNSSRDLAARFSAREGEVRDVIDLDLAYLPVGVGNALRVIAPVVRRNSRAEVPSFVIPASNLTPEQLKLTNIVYLGYLSGLGSLRDPLFSGSRFGIGSSYDEIVDRWTGRRFLAGSHLDAGTDTPTRDYALIAGFKGVGGNQIVVIGGTRDAALMQAADFATRPETLNELTRAVGAAEDFEALLAVDSLRGVGLRANIVWAGSRRATKWDGQPQVFPDSSTGVTANLASLAKSP